MHHGRRMGLLMMLAVGLAGCRADGMGSLSLLPRRNAAPLSFDLDGFIAEHNRNAAAIQSLEARPSIVAAMRIHRVNVEGHLAMERPRNFKMELGTHGESKADIGSNAEEFWYWVANPDKDQKWIYWCNYRDVEASELPVDRQPDWIIEALGLRPITAQEAAGIKVGRGPDSSSTLLTFPVTRDRGEPFAREMIVSNTDLRIKKLRILGQNPRAPIAEAVLAEYQVHATGGASRSAPETCYLPQKLTLDWKRDQLVLDVVLRDVRVNQFDHAMAADIFVEPEKPGYTRLNLAQDVRGQRPERRTRTRQTMPPPDARDEIHLGRPAPIKDDEPIVPRVGRRAPRPSSEGEDAPSPTLEPVVGAPIARPPDSGPMQASMMPGPPGRYSSIEQ